MSNTSSIARLLHWFRQRAGSLRTEVVREGAIRTVRTIETVETRECTLLIGSVHAGGFNECPVCGSKLVPTLEDPDRPQLHD